MATCPHCGRKLHFRDWRPECPDCGTHLTYYNSNLRLLEESERTEIEHAAFQPKVDRAKAAYAGSPLAIIRIVLTLIPIGALFLPLVVSGSGKGANVIEVYKAIDAYGLGNVFSDALKQPACLAVALLLLSAASLIVSIILISMSLGKHGKIRVVITYGVMFLLAAGSLITALFAGESTGVFSDGAEVFGPGVGAYFYVALFLVLFVYNVFLINKGIPVKYTPCLIGGLPSEEYHSYVEQGYSITEIRRKMLVALAELDAKLDETLEEEGAAK